VPDVAILCVGGDQAEAQLRLCASLGVRNAILFASGFAEVGPAGRARQQQLADICREGGVRLVGPNCIGVSNFSTGAVLSFASIFADVPPQDGAIAIVSQSGGVGVCAYALLRADGWGVRYVATSGNESDVDGADYVEALAHDGEVRLILLYLENIASEPRMRAALEAAAARGVPVLALRAGRSAEGIRSAGCHTGSSGAATDAIDRLFDEVGCRTVDRIDELITNTPLYLSAAWSAPPSLKTPGIALISNSGAACVMAADEAARRGLRPAVLSDETRARLDGLLPDFSPNRNPIDLTAALLSDSSLLGTVTRATLDDPDVAGATLGLLAIGGLSYDTPRFARDAADAARATCKPLVIYSPHVHVRSTFAQCGHAVCSNESEALQAVESFIAHRARFRRRE
jgi:acyl-CoA synthetase (NDP forming)